MNELDKLQELLTRLPGIGPRQARRFAYFFMNVSQGYIDELVDALGVLRSNKFHCQSCNRIYFRSHTHHDNTRCPTCRDETRDASKLLILAKQADYENVLASGFWDGHFFIVGRTVRLADKTPENSLPIALLRQRLDDFELKEVVMGLPLNPEGEYTGQIIEDSITDLQREHGLSISHLARGLSVGSELEYSDPQTIQAALDNRS